MMKQHVKMVKICVREEQYKKKLQDLAKLLAKEGLQAEFLQTEPVNDTTGDDTKGNDGILYLSDDPEFLYRLQEREFAAAALQLESRQDEKFTGISYVIEKAEELDRNDFERIYCRLKGLPWYILETKRCILREITVEDVNRLYEIYEEPSITDYMENLFPEKEEEKKYTKQYIQYVYGLYEYGIWIVEEKSSGIIIGRAGIEEKPEGTELGYMIACPWQNKGYAFEVCNAILKYAKEELQLEQIFSRVHKNNKSSVKLLEKLGFHELNEISLIEPDMRIYKKI